MMDHGLEGEAKEYVDRLEVNVDLLCWGWTEKIEYEVSRAYHNPDSTCPGYVLCTCPRVKEKRTRALKRGGLLNQLKEYQQNKDVDRNPKAARGAPRVKKPKLHPEMAGFLTLDEITCEAYMLLDRVFEEADRDRTWLAQPLSSVLTGLVYQVTQFAQERPDLARTVVKATDTWVRKARSALRVTVSEAMFGDTVCGNCGGGLAVAWDNSTDVRCVGSPAEGPCGHTYPMEEWISLYEQQRAE